MRMRCGGEVVKNPNAENGNVFLMPVRLCSYLCLSKATARCQYMAIAEHNYIGGLELATTAERYDCLVRFTMYFNLLLPAT